MSGTQASLVTIFCKVAASSPGFESVFSAWKRRKMKANDKSFMHASWVFFSFLNQENNSVLETSPSRVLLISHWQNWASWLFSRKRVWKGKDFCLFIYFFNGHIVSLEQNQEGKSDASQLAVCCISLHLNAPWTPSNTCVHSRFSLSFLLLFSFSFQESSGIFPIPVLLVFLSPTGNTY